MWDIVIGLETHVQLATKSKIFSTASTAFGALANHHANMLDRALPGTLPMLNKEVIGLALRFGLAIQAKIDTLSRFDRKHYFYPDLPKGYQTSQYYRPIIAQGVMPFWFNGAWDSVDITRAHLEEDAGKSLHDAFYDGTGIDLNRAGTPLLEIVTEPQLTSPQQAVAYAKALHHMVKWLKICDGNMQEGSFRCDANVSIKPKGSSTLGTRCEIKNLNSFKFLEEAMEAEIARQIELIEDGKTVIQQTRLYDAVNKQTKAMRSKEDAHDYRYFPCPDLMNIYISDKEIEDVQQNVGILPKDLWQKLLAEGLNPQDAQTLTQDMDVAHYFLEMWQAAPELGAKNIANWLIGEVFAYLNKHAISIQDAPLKPLVLVDILQHLHTGVIHQKAAKTLLALVWDAGLNHPPISQLIHEHGLIQMQNTAELEAVVHSVIQEQQKLVDEYKSGKEKAFNALVGQVMKRTQGKANPAQVHECLMRHLG